jgi:hypothetical protein
LNGQIIGKLFVYFGKVEIGKLILFIKISRKKNNLLFYVVYENNKNNI